MRNVERVIILYPADIDSARMSQPGNYSLSRLLIHLHRLGDIPVYYFNTARRHEQYGNIEFIHFTWLNFLRLIARFAFTRNSLILSQMGAYPVRARILRALMPGSRICVRLGGVYFKKEFLDSPAFRSERRKQQRMVAAADMVISTADGTPVDLYMRKVGVPPARYRKWLNGFPVIPNSANQQRENIILCISRLHRGKLIDAVVRAFALARPRLSVPYSLRIVGDGPERASLLQLARSLGVEQHVEFVGHSNDVGPHLYASKLLVSGLTNNPVMEAIATGTPVVTAEWGEVRALYGHYPNVHVVECPHLGFGAGPAADIDLLVQKTSDAIVNVLDNYPVDPSAEGLRSPLASWGDRIQKELELCDTLFDPAAVRPGETVKG